MPALSACPARLIAAALLLALAAPAFAARPLATEDDAVLDGGTCESDSYAGRSIARAAPAANAVSTQFGCGIGHGTYLGAAWARADHVDGEPQTVVVAGKTRLGEPADDGVNAALAWGTVSKKLRGTGFHYDGLYTTLAAAAPLAPGWTGFANLGATRDHERHPWTARWSAAVDRVIAADVHVGVEAFADNRQPGPWLQGGVAFPLPAGGLTANASWGTRLGWERERLATAGVTWDF